MTGGPLFEDRIEAWQCGPVVPAVIHAFGEWGDAKITAPTEQTGGQAGRRPPDRLRRGEARFLALPSRFTREWNELTLWRACRARLATA